MIRRLLMPFALAAGLVLAATSVSAQGVTTTGTLAATGDSVTIPFTAVPSAAVQVSGTWVGTVVFEFTVDGGTIWWPLRNDNGDWLTAFSVSAVIVQNRGYTAIRARASDLASGSVTVTSTRGYGAGADPVLKGVDSSGVVRPLGVTPLRALTAPGGFPVPLCNPVTRNAGNCR